MPTVRFALSEEYYKRLVDMAKQDGISLQDCIRNRLFHVSTIYTPAEAVKRALQRYKQDETFTLPDLYPEWDLQRGPAGAFGKQFFAYVKNKYSDKIQFDKMINCGRRAQYIIL